MNKLFRRLLSTACAAMMLLSNAAGSLIGAIAEDSPAEEETVLSETAAENELYLQSFELYPNGEDAEQVITLEGMLPEGVTAEAADVSEEYGGVAAYDISLSRDGDEYQPETEKPVTVEICDPAIRSTDSLELWHILDDGTREQLTHFTLSDGRITFNAYGFSVYEIVDDAVGEGSALFDRLAEQGANGLYVPFIVGTPPNANNGPYYFKSGIVENVRNNGRSGLDITAKSNTVPSDAVKLYFEREKGTKNKFYIYTLGEGGEKKYLRMFILSGFNAGRSALDYASTKDERTLFTLEKNDNDQVRISAVLSDGKSHYWVRNTNDNKIAVVGYNVSKDATMVWLTLDELEGYDDALGLDGRTYGLMSFSGGTHGYALMAGEPVHTLVELVTHQTKDSEGVTLYVDEGSEVSRWTFHADENGRYKLSAETNGAVKYLTVSGNELVMTDSADSAAAFAVTASDQGKIQLSTGGKYVTFSEGDEDAGTVSSFGLSDTAGADSWLSFLAFANLSDDDYLTFTADRKSISEIENGQKVIVYTRIWDEVNKKYDMYAVDYNGTLYPCYASGGKILWLGDGTGSLEWEFTEYYDAVTKQPNYYYELYNSYSEKYISPRISEEQILSDTADGINMPGRRNGEFYSEIIAWDDNRYAYIGMKPNDEKTRLIPCSQSVSMPFYFAVIEDLEASTDLTEVPTVDNFEHGVTIKMQDFSTRASMSNFLGNDQFVSQSTQAGLLSTNLGSDGYPTAKGGSLKNLYTNPNVVNHLFIESVYNSSGYFEFDSCQNFASLCEPDGTLKTPVNHTNTDGTVTQVTDFTVYKELGTTDNESKSTLKHGQFLPYNIIKPGKYASKNGQNLYSAFANTTDASAGVLDDDDPRKYEKLLQVNDSAGKDNPNYYNGMEIEASFVQTVSGLDAWGHDIIFEFTGDDDFWLYVDNELVIDLGGIHSALEGKVNFRTGEVYVNGTTTTLKEIFRKNLTARGESDVESKLNEIFEDNGKGQFIFKDYTIHTMKIFYMERGAGASNLHMRFNLASVTPGHVVVSKNVTGDGADLLDKDFIEYPFQIYYTLPEGPNGEPGDEHLLGNDQEHIRVTYQNSNQPVTFVRKYRPPGFTEEQAYENIYFINPSKSAEIAFPDNTINYRIVECAVDSTVYGNVMINGESVPSNRVEIIGDLRSYSSEVGSAETKPQISFDNVVNDNVIKDLLFTKRLYDEDNKEVTNDPTGFSFRLYIASVDDGGDIPLANMYPYYVLNADKEMCRFDPVSKTFVTTKIPYSREVVTRLKEGTVDGYTYDDVTFTTSGFGAISGIPAGLTVCVPGLPVGSVFKLTEDVKSGYGLMGYERINGTKVNEDHSVEDIPSYLDRGSINEGTVIAESNPIMEVKNKKGYGLTVNKKWSDLELTTGHAPVYTAVYVDGELLEGSVREIRSPKTSAYYFWTALKPLSGGIERTDFDGYVVKEVTIENTSPAVDDEGRVADPGTVTPIESGSGLSLLASRTAAATPEGEESDRIYEYVATYRQGASVGAVRSDTITNTRSGGLAVRLFRWDSTEPLSGGTFTLADSEGDSLGEFVSDAEGLVTMLYSFERNKLYTLTQTAAPKGYVGIQNTVLFKVNDDDSVSMFYDDGSTQWGSRDAEDLRWSDWKRGANGITAFVDVYNKPFNFKIAKTDHESSDIQLSGAHFALFKQVNASISGYIKNKDPMTGFEDMTTYNGEVYVCGGDSGRSIAPGKNGSVYFLTETKAPFGYSKLEDDIVFRISPIGVPTLISDAYNGQLVEEDDCYVYTLSVPNVRTQTQLQLLTIRKRVAGSLGNKAKEFSFSISVEGDSSEDIVWAKNGDQQPYLPHSGGSFTLKHGDSVEIALPEGVTLTVSEDSGDYTSVFCLDGGADQQTDTLTFEFTGTAELVVTNTLSGVIHAGISSGMGKALAAVFIPFTAIAFLVYTGRRRKKAQQL